MKLKDPEIIEQFQIELRQLRYKYGNRLLEWTHVAQILEKEILPLIYEGVHDEMENLERENQKLRAWINQFSFGNDPERDKKITELFNCGVSRGKIAKAVGMSRWGVSKALRRLGVN